MIYNVTDNRVTIKGYFFEMDTQNTIHVYAKNMEYFDMINVGYSLSYDEFKFRCEEWLVKNF